MNSSSNSSGKHPMKGPNNTKNGSGSGVVLGGGDKSMKSANNCKDDTQKFPQSSNSEMMREDGISGTKFGIQEDSDSNVDDSDSSDEKEDISEIGLKKILLAVSKGYSTPLKLTEAIHFNPDHPEFHNVYIPNINNSYAMIYDGKDWKLVQKMI